MSKKLTVTLGQDLSAYATFEVPADTDLSDLAKNLTNFMALGSPEDLVFEPNWEATDALRVISITDEKGGYVRGELQIEPSHYDGGMHLKSFLSGRMEGLGDLINAAAEAKLIETPEWVTQKGSLTTPGGEVLEVSCRVRKGATQAEKDLALIQALAQICTIDIAAEEVPRCPNTAREGSDLVGCGSTNVHGPDEEGLYDCLDCGLFFRLDDEKQEEVSRG